LTAEESTHSSNFEHWHLACARPPQSLPSDRTGHSKLTKRRVASVGLLVSHQGLWKMWYAVGSGHSTTCSTQKRLQTRTCHSFEHINLHRDRHPVLTGDRGYSLRFSSNLKTKQARYSPRKGGLIQSSTVPHCSGTTQHWLCTTCARH